MLLLPLLAAYPVVCCQHLLQQQQQLSTGRCRGAAQHIRCGQQTAATLLHAQVGGAVHVDRGPAAYSSAPRQQWRLQLQHSACCSALLLHLCNCQRCVSSGPTTHRFPPVTHDVNTTHSYLCCTR